MTTPVLAYLHQRYPAAVIDIVCDPRSAPLFEACPYRGDLLLRDKRDGWRGVLRLLQRCRQHEYALAIDLKTDFLLPFVRAKFKLAKLPAAESRQMHSVHKHWQALRTLLEPQGAMDTPLPLTLWHRPAVMMQLAKFDCFPGAGRCLMIGLGANSAHKRWPVAAFVTLAHALQDWFDEIFLLGDNRDSSLASAFLSAFRGKAYSLCGQLELPATYAALRHAAYFVGNDSGLGHMAAAAGIPTMTIFGPGEPHRYLPWSPDASYYQDPEHSIMQVTPEQVLKVMQFDLNRRSHLASSGRRYA